MIMKTLCASQSKELNGTVKQTVLKVVTEFTQSKLAKPPLKGCTSLHLGYSAYQPSLSDADYF